MNDTSVKVSEERLREILRWIADNPSRIDYRTNEDIHAALTELLSRRSPPGGGAEAVGDEPVAWWVSLPNTIMPEPRVFQVEKEADDYLAECKMASSQFTKRPLYASPPLPSGDGKGPTRDELKALIRKGLTDNLKNLDDGSRFDVDVLLRGCEHAMHSRGYQNPTEAADILAGFTADLILKSLHTEPAGEGGVPEGWQDISTAPDGEQIIVWEPMYGWLLACKDHLFGWQIKSSGNFYADMPESVSSSLTHWRPIGDRPSTAEALNP